MLKYTQRFYKDDADYELMRRLLIDTYPLVSPPLNLLLGEIDWWRSISDVPDLLSKIQLWFSDANELVAFVWPGFEKIDVMIHPEHRNIERQILQNTKIEKGQTLSYWSYESDIARIQILNDFGFTRVDEEYLACYFLDLQASPAARAVSANYLVRSFAGESEIESRVEAHRSAFHPSKMSVEKHRLVMSTPTYQQNLDIVCVAPHGVIAAATIVWFDPINKVGILEPVACHVDHQRRGLASAVMTEGLRRLFALGGHCAYVMSQREDSPGAGTYRSLGFKVIGRLYEWKKSG